MTLKKIEIFVVIKENLIYLMYVIKKTFKNILYHNGRF